MKWIWRVLLAIALCWCALVEAAEVFAGTVCHMRIDGDWFLLIAASSSKEIGEFFRAYSVGLTFGIAVLLVLWLVILGFLLFAKRWLLWGFLIFVLAYVGWNCRTPSCFRSWNPVYVAYDTVRSTREYAELIKAGMWDEAAGCGVKSVSEGEWTNLVVVIGESMTTDRMSLYGYDKQTTPQLDALKDEMTVMDPVRPNWADTVRSLRMMFTRASEAEPDHARETSAVAFRRRGYRPVFIGAQPKWGRFCGVEHLIFSACETCTYIGEGRVEPDEALLPYLEREMAFSADEPFVIFVQLQGSHFDPKYRVPPNFTTPEGFDDYDRSVYYTDSILGQMVRMLPPRTTLVYLSDHGESPDSPSWRDLNSPSVWRVPLVVYPKRKNLMPVKTLDQVFNLLLEVVGGRGER